MKKILIILAVSILGIIFLWYIFKQTTNSSYIISIKTEQDATVSIARNKTEAFENIGVGSAEIRVTQDDPVYIKASKGFNESISTINPDGGDEEVFIEIAEIENEKSIYSKPIVSPYWEKDVVHGVDERSHSMSSTSDGRYVIPEISFISVPYVKSVIWRNIDNYVYNAFSGGAGMVVNGINAGVEYFEDAILRVSEEGEPMEAAKSPSSPLVLLSTKELFVSPNFNSTLNKIASLPLYDNYYFRADDEYIYFARLPGVTEYATEDTEIGSSGLDSGESSTFYIYNYSGDLLLELELPEVHNITGVVQKGDGYALSTDSSVLTIDKSGNITNHLDLYINPGDMSEFNEKLYLFSDSGVWYINDNFDSILLYNRLDGESYVSGSLQPYTPNDSKLLFTTVNRATYTGRVLEFNPNL